MRQIVIVCALHVDAAAREGQRIDGQRGECVGGLHRDVDGQHVEVAGIVRFLDGINQIIDFLGVLYDGLANGGQRFQLDRKAERLPHALDVFGHGGLALVLSVGKRKAAARDARLGEQCARAVRVRGGLQHIALHLAEGLALGRIEDGVGNQAGCGIRIDQQIGNRPAVDRHRERAADSCIRKQRVSRVEQVGIGRVCIGKMCLFLQCGALCQRHVAHIDEVGLGLVCRVNRIKIVRIGALALRLVFLFNKGHKNAVRLDIAIQLVFLGVTVVIVVALDAHGILVAVDLLDGERAVGDQGRMSARPVAIVVCDRLLAERNQRDGGKILLEVLVVDLFLKRDLEQICIQRDHAEVVDRGVARLDGARVLHLVQQGGCGALIGAFHQALPCEDKVVRRQRAAVRPLGLLDGNLHLVFMIRFVFEDRDLVGQRLDGLALGIEAVKPLKKHTEQLDRRLVRHVDARVKRIYIAGNVGVKNVSLILIRHVDGTAAGRERQHNGHEAQQESQNSFHCN